MALVTARRRFVLTQADFGNVGRGMGRRVPTPQFGLALAWAARTFWTNGAKTLL